MEPTYQTIGQFYAALDQALAGLPPDAWAPAPRNQLTDHPFFAGELFPVVDHPTASAAIRRIVSEGEGTTKTPLDFEGEVAHYYRFEEIHRDRVLQKDGSVPEGFVWGEPLGVDWSAVVAAIADPGEHDFSGDPAAQAAQDACDKAYTAVLQELDLAVNGRRGASATRCGPCSTCAWPPGPRSPPHWPATAESAGPAFRFRPDLV